MTYDGSQVFMTPILMKIHCLFTVKEYKYVYWYNFYSVYKEKCQIESLKMRELYTKFYISSIKLVTFCIRV